MLFFEKKSVLIPILLLTFPAFSLSFFDGSAGIRGDYGTFNRINDDEDFDESNRPLKFQGFFAGQLNFGRSFVLRGEFSFTTEDVIKDGWKNIFKDNDADFNLNELSATYIKPLGGLTHYVSLYRGSMEPLGSGQFLQRKFGVKPYGSAITESWLGSRGLSIYDYDASIGGVYSFKANRVPLAAALYVYRNDNNDGGNYQPNVDVRFGAAFRYLLLDASMGISAPIYTRDSAGKRVTLLIDDYYLHGGVDMLIGSRNFISLLVQFGTSSLKFDGDGLDEDYKGDNIGDKLYLLIEPRINLQYFNVSATFFNLPPAKLDSLWFADSPFGFNIGASTDFFRIMEREFTVGMNLTLTKDSMSLTDLNDLADFSKRCNVKVSPYISTEIYHGELKAMLQILAVAGSDSLKESCKFSLGYKINF